MAAGCVIGVDLGGTKLLAGTVDGDLRVHHRAYRRVPGMDGGAVLDTVLEAIGEARETARDDVAAVGLGLPCLVDVVQGRSLTCNHLVLDGVPVRDMLSERLGLPVVVDHDANAALLAETRFGAARGDRHVVMLTIGTGVGGAVLIDGRILRGRSGAAGELGHVVIDEAGPPCPGRCPNHGCLEAFVSGPALAGEGRRLAEGAPHSALGQAHASGREISGALVTELAHDGDAAARDALTRMGEHLGVGIVNLVNVFNPDTVVVGGGVVAAGDLLLGPARTVLAQRGLVPARDQVRVVPARFGSESGMLGAAALALELL
jgi:glucokinase